MSKYNIDELDKQILGILRFKGRIAFSVMADKLKVSEGTIRKRVKEMQESGIIEKFTVETKTPFDFRAVICIHTDPKIPTLQIVNSIKKLPHEINHIYEVLGEWDIICLGETHSHEELNKILERIRLLPGVTKTKSHAVLVMR